LRGNFIAQGRERRGRTLVGDEALPGGVAVQFRQNRWQVIRQALAFGGRQRWNRGFNISNGAHLAAKLRRPRRAVK
jgi:hypothetical protein